MGVQDHARAFFDSADWALCKVKCSRELESCLFTPSSNKCHYTNQNPNSITNDLVQQGAAMNQESTVPMETLRPKLQVPFLSRN